MNGVAIQVRLLGLIAIGTVCSFIACSGGGAQGPSNVDQKSSLSVTLSLDVQETNALDTVGLTATVSGSTNTSVTWLVDDIPGGNDTVGTISGTGTTATYIAPAAAGTHTITAASLVDSSKKASAPIVVKTPAMTITVAPATAATNAGETVPLVATVSGSRHTSVQWSVDGVANGNATTGTITGSGASVTYTAPAAPGTHTVAAASTANPLVKGQSSILVQTANAPVQVTVDPASATLTAGATRSFTATVINTTNTAVTWSVDGVVNGNTTTGTLTGSGNTMTYKAPPAAGTHTVKATSVADPNQSFSASVTVTSTAGVNLGPAAAFPGCEGMGCGATGGRGGDVYTVNTLADTTNPGCVPQNGPNGPTCSLRDAMTKSGPRTIVFSVGGTITLHSAIYSVPPGLTIAGQTAPGGGIQIRGDGLWGGGSSMLWLNGNSIVRYLKIRPGNVPLNSSDQGLAGLAISRDATDDVVIDHNSFQWDSNKATTWWSSNGLRRNTFSWNLVAESLAPHSTGLLAGGPSGQTTMDQSSWDGHHNILATIDHRLPQTWVKYGRWINNLATGYSYAMLVRGGTQFDIIGNAWDGMSSSIKADRRHEVRWADTYENNENQIVPSGTAQIYMSNNFGPNNPQGTLDNFSSMLRRSSGENGELLDSPPVETKFKAIAATIPSSLNTWRITTSTINSVNDLKTILTPTAGAYRRLGCDGAWVSSRDAVDERIIDYIRNPLKSPSAYITIAGPYPALSAGTRCADSDGDGMPDVWEDAHGLNKNDPSDRNIVRANASRYTNLELYLSGLFPNGTPLP